MRADQHCGLTRRIDFPPLPTPMWNVEGQFVDLCNHLIPGGDKDQEEINEV